MLRGLAPISRPPPTLLYGRWMIGVLLLAYLVVWAVIFPVQTLVVHAENADDIQPLYFVVNAIILAGGIGLNTLGARIRNRRLSKA